MIPTTSPRLTSKETSFKAQIVPSLDGSVELRAESEEFPLFFTLALILKEDLKASVRVSRRVL
jgi:hypothetical protein